MLGLIGLLLLAAIRRPALRMAALLAGLTSGLVFALLTWRATTSEEVVAVALVDVAVVPLLVAALVVSWRDRSTADQR
jgi:hypothetical protein